MKEKHPQRILLVTGMSGAGKSTVLKTLEDIGWETVDNLPLTLLERLLATPLLDGENSARPLAIGIDSRTRGFDANAIVERMNGMRDNHRSNISTLFLDCSGVNWNGAIPRPEGGTRWHKIGQQVMALRANAK